MNAETLKQLQAIETDILVVIDKFCLKHGIRYSLYAGTALGAVRHGGFIPWDDDVDICMDRNEYIRFLTLWRSDPTQGYTLVGDDEPGCHINHSKIHKDNTILSSNEDIKKDKHHGIWIDVFAFDKVPIDKKIKKKMLRAAKLRLVYTRQYPYIGGSKLLNLVSRILLMKSRKRMNKLKKKYSDYVMRYKDISDHFNYVGFECPRTLRDFYPQDIFNTHRIMFNGVELSLSDKAEEMLQIKYGDYMQLPPENERVCSHNPQIICFDATKSDN